MSAAIEPADIQPDSGFLNMTMSVQEAKRRLAELQEFIRSVMVPGEDYGKIRGSKKPTLHKPGAEKLCEVYGLAPTFEVTNRIERWEEPGFFHYEVRCRLVHRRTGVLVAEGLGSCNSLESKYRYRWVFDDELPKGIDKSRLVTRQTKDGIQYRIENDDIFSLPNTILKMAKKRALIDAVLSATRSSGIFTQDVEDVGFAPDDETDAGDESQPAERDRRVPRTATPQPKGNRLAPVQPKGRIDWSGFWKTVKGELGLDERAVHEQAATFFGRPGLKSLTEVAKDQSDLDRFLKFLRALPHESPTGDEDAGDEEEVWES